MIIGFLNQKGGVGKTTLTLSVAHCLSKEEKKVLVVDADPQGSSLSWSEVREEKLPFSIMGLSTKTLHRDLPEISANYDYVIIDSPPRVTSLVRSCILASDVVLIPCTPSPYDIWASEETLKLLEESSVYKEKLKYFFVINRKITNTAIGKEASNALKNLGVKVLDSHISQRVVFAEAAAQGHTVFEISSDNKAVCEIERLTKEIKKVIND